jgi:uncharacterized membrane protein
MVEVEGAVDAPIGTVWESLRAVELWPQWMPTVTSVEPREPGDHGVGASFRVRQPRLPATTWIITEWDEAQGFTWRARGLGLVTIGDHRIREEGDRTRARLSIDWSGPLAGVARVMYRRVAQVYLNRELRALRLRAQAISQEPS